MKLTLQDIRAIVHGALDVREADGKFVFTRFTDRQQAHYDEIKPDFGVKAHATSGVRLEFVTDAEKFSFDYHTKIASSRVFYYFDVFVDGVMMQHFGHDKIKEATSTVTVKLPEGKHRVAVYFPCLAEARIYNVTLDDGAILEPVQKSRRMLCYGDSITQGYDAQYSSQTYANLIADKLDAEMINQGIGGEIFRPELIDPELDFEPDIITVAYGTNDWSGQERERTVNNANAFYAKLRATYPNAKIFAITPIWRADDDRVTKVGTFAQGVQIVRDAAAAQDGVVIVDGARMIPHLREVCADKYLHPNDYGFKFYANALHDAIKPHLD
ncbi:MAG: SGNH/GDSL hydrolase family protein [Ruminococcaceae bacterium]|nr:SGNH/GDSL hydrolase family protein [Oscillospiraceae bacterium]